MGVWGEILEGKGELFKSHVDYSGHEGDLAATPVTPPIARIDLADLAG